MRPNAQPAVYIMTNRKDGVLYTGVTSSLIGRVYQHREKRSGFSARYRCDKLVWFEMHGDMYSAINREKRIKAGSRARKIALIETDNPEWRDLYAELTGE
ncbi:MAG: GIY-YIG nuclease family protein [Alphaproteobacteria bacterium]|nr:GIY-YIG nuclease family protein [Alphaproteobacteria bacterium]MBU0866303.1 GIY-YIG nuclease family protein [Alphaproteobacteria bacterium]MBU1826089.1 GIY-YIG nuclease family protein [Alphaproteobacteria bacterium]